MLFKYKFFWFINELFCFGLLNNYNYDFFSNDLLLRSDFLDYDIFINGFVELSNFKGLLFYLLANWLNKKLFESLNIPDDFDYTILFFLFNEPKAIEPSLVAVLFLLYFKLFDLLYNKLFDLLYNKLFDLLYNK